MVATNKQVWIPQETARILMGVDGTTNMCRIAFKLNISYSHASKIKHFLEQKRLITLKRINKRQKNLHLTKKGLIIANACRTIIKEWS